MCMYLDKMRFPGYEFWCTAVLDGWNVKIGKPADRRAGCRRYRHFCLFSSSLTLCTRKCVCVYFAFIPNVDISIVYVSYLLKFNAST